MTLVGMSLALVGPFLVLTVVDRLFPDFRLAVEVRARVGVSLLFLITGAAHFAKAQPIAAALPAFLPWRPEMVYALAALEILCAIGLWIPHMVAITGDSMILMLILIMPANIYAAMNHVDIGGHAMGPGDLLVRIPFHSSSCGGSIAPRCTRSAEKRRSEGPRRPREPTAKHVAVGGRGSRRETRRREARGEGNQPPSCCFSSRSSCQISSARLRWGITIEPPTTSATFMASRYWASVTPSSAHRVRW